MNKKIFLMKKKQNMNKLPNALDKIKTVIYGDKFSLIEFK